MLLGLTGVAHSGKSTIADILRDTYGFKQYYFASGVKQALYNMNPIVKQMISSGYYGQILHLPLQEIVDSIGWDEAKKIPMVRELLQRMGTEAGRDIHGKNVWVDRTFKQMFRECTWEWRHKDGINTRHAVSDIVIPDLRFNNEAERIKHHGGVIIRVDRGLEAVNGHSSENGLDLSLVDINLNNRGTLEETCRAVIGVLEYIGYENIRGSRYKS